MYTLYPDTESLKTLNAQATSDHAYTLNFLYSYIKSKNQSPEQHHFPLATRSRTPPGATTAGVTQALHGRDVPVVHNGQLRMPIPRRSNGVAPEHDEREDEPKELEFGELLGALLRGACAAVDVAVGVTASRAQPAGSMGPYRYNVNGVW